MATNVLAGTDKQKTVVFVAGTPSHGYGSHEHNAGSLLLAKTLQQALPHFQCRVVQNGWPKSGMAEFESADAVVVYCDGGPRHLLNPHIDEFAKLMDKGVGLCCIHYGVEVPKGKSGEAFLEWIGGYFETNWSVNPHWTARFQEFPDHPVANGVKPFEINDEWYFHMRFQPGMEGVTPILSAVPPHETMSRPDGEHSGNPYVRRAVAQREPQHTGWVYQRPNGGRGFGFTGGHKHWNWGDDNFRKVVLNAIVWTAHGTVPPDGVQTTTPTQADLEANQDFTKDGKKAAKRTQARQAKTLLVAASAEQAQDTSHDPARAVENLDVHPQLHATLFASEPLMMSPSNIDVDHRGRIWVCEIINYRSHARKRPEGDRILILEDTDGDGIADDRKVFYQGSDIDSPHGVCVLGNRVIVSAAGKVLSFIDENGDDVPDKKEVMYSGISGAQHDHGIHAFTFGPDGKLYFNFGNDGKQLRDANGREVVDVAGNVVRADRNPYQEGMVFRQNLDGSGLETLGWNFRNNWMVTVDSFGTVWQSDNDDDGNRGVRINFVMEFGNYGYKDEMTGAGWRTPRTGMSQLPEQHWHLNDPGVVPNLLHTGAGSPTGITVYEGDLMPVSLQGQLIHCDAGPSVTRAYLVSDDGAGYSAEIANILEGSRDRWFRPSDIKVAPDGSLLVADWYDPGVGGHRMGDLDRGRIFRVIPKGHDGGYEIPNYDYSTAKGAVEALRNPNYAIRYMAWTALHKMGGQAEAPLLAMWQDSNPRMRARALWLLGKIEGRGRHYVDVASRDEDPNIRIVSLRLARQLADVDALPVVARLVNDSSPAVRRECAIAIRHNESDEAAQLWATLAKQHDGRDRWYLEALGIGADQQWDRFMTAWYQMVDGNWNTAAGRDLVWRSRAPKTAQWLAATINQSSVPKEELPRYFRALDFVPEDARQEAVASLVTKLGAGNDARDRMVAVESVRRLSPATVAGNAEFEAVLDRTLNSLERDEDFIDLVSRFDMRDRFVELVEIAQSRPGEQAGVAAIRGLFAKGQRALVEDALASSTGEALENTITVLGNSSSGEAVDLLDAIVKSDDRDIEVRRSALRSMARIRAGAFRLLDHVKSEALDEALVPASAAALTQAPWRDIRYPAVELFPLPPSKEQTPLRPIVELVNLKGDATNGQRVFAGTGTCAKCHIVAGKGKEVGPNLTEIGSKLSREAMFESILYPSAGISHNYESYSVVTEDGDSATGLLTSSTDDEVVITSADGIARTFKRRTIDELQKLKVSLMPADIQKLMTEQELVDVVDYLTTLKKQ